MSEEINSMSYEAAMTELEGIVGKLESDTVQLDELASLVKRAHALSAYCKAKLRSIEEDLEKLNNEE